MQADFALCTREVVGECLKFLIRTGMVLSPGIEPNDMIQVYVAALSGRTEKAVREVTKQLHKGEIILEIQRFIPIPPEFARLVRGEEVKMLVEIRRLKDHQRTLQETKKAGIRKDPASIERVREKRARFRRDFGPKNELSEAADGQQADKNLNSS